MSHFLEILPFPAAQYELKADLENESRFIIEYDNTRWRELSSADVGFNASSVYDCLQGIIERCIALGEDRFQLKPNDLEPIILIWGRKLTSEANHQKWVIMALDAVSVEVAEAERLLQRIEELNVTHDQDELALRISLRHLKAFFDESVSGKALIGLDGELISTNRALNRILGWPYLSNSQNDVNRSIPWTDKAKKRLQENFNKLLSDGLPIQNLELEMMDTRGEPLFFWVSLSPVLDSLGRPLYIAAELSDITQQAQNRRQLKVQAQELEESNRELARSNAELERFAFVASHDLQEPLRKICVFGERLENELKKSNSSEQANVYLSRIVASTQRMTKLISGVLDYSRLSQKSATLQPVDLSELLQEMTQDFDFKGAALFIDPLPIVLGNPTRLSRLFANLLSNALKFRGTEPTEIHIEARADMATPGFFVVAVRDNGIGFDMESSEKIFDVFTRLHPRDLYDGTGIGLAICRRIANESGGDVWAQSELNQGATFFVKLSLPDREDEEQA